MISWFGCASIGLILGWTIGRFIGRFHRSFVNGLLIGIGMILLSIEIHLLADWLSLALFFGGTVVTFFIHLEWMRRLRFRFGAIG